MTRETKIGLLVGLAFIIVIGILLSDHMTSTTQPPQAALGEAAANVRESATAPAPTSPAPAPLVNVPPITPSNPVLTQVELRPPAPPQQAANVAPAVTRVQVGGPALPQQPATPIEIRRAGPPVVVADARQGQQRPAPQEPVAPPVVVANNPSAAEASGSSLEQWAQLHGEPLVPVGGGNGNTRPEAPPAAPLAPTAAKREYVAQVGDSLSRIAAKFYGSGTRANMDLLIKANASLQKNPDIVVEGRKYVIPQAPAAAAAPIATPDAGATVASGTVPATPPARIAPAARPIPVTELVDSLPAVTPVSGSGYWYVVKENDNLWKIAAEQLGSGNAWTQIKEMNRDVLKGGDNVQPNMRLRLPAKPLASAS